MYLLNIQQNKRNQSGNKNSAKKIIQSQTDDFFSAATVVVAEGSVLIASKLHKKDRFKPRFVASKGDAILEIVATLVLVE